MVSKTDEKKKKKKIGCFSLQNQQGQNTDGNLIPQIVMNPWDPNQGVQMTLQTTAVARQLQLQWLAAQQQAQAQEEEEEEEETSKVVCLAPDEEMGFLLNLPPPCNVLTSPSTIGISGPLKVKPTGYHLTFEKFLRGT